MGRRPGRRPSATGEVAEAVVDRKVPPHPAPWPRRVGALGGLARGRAGLGRGRRRLRPARPPSRAPCCWRTGGELPWDPARLRHGRGDRRQRRPAPAPRAAAAPRCCPRTPSRRWTACAPRCPAADVSYALGAVVQEGVAELPLAQLTNPVTGEPGLRVRFLDADGAELFAEDRRATALWSASAATRRSATAATVRARPRGYTPGRAGPVRLGFAAVGHRHGSTSTASSSLDDDRRVRAAPTSAPRSWPRRPPPPRSSCAAGAAARAARRVRPAAAPEPLRRRAVGCTFGTEPGRRPTRTR